MTLDQLKYALELQRTKNFSRAAENCHIAQPSLSIQIAKLEEELGISIFNRTRSGVEITDYGKELLKQARVIMDESARMSQLAAELKGEVRGAFRLGIIPTLAPYLLPAVLGELRAKYPQVQMTVSEDRTERLVHAIDEGTLDGAILSTPNRCPDTLMEKVLFYEPFVVFASSGHKILERKSVTTEQISSDEILILDETHCLRDQVLQLCKAKQKLTGDKLRIQSASLQTLMEYIRHNEGYTLLPGLAAALLPQSEQNKNIRPMAKPVPSRKISLVFHQARLKRSLIEAIKECTLKVLPDTVYLTSSGQDIRIVSPSAEHFEL